MTDPEFDPYRPPDAPLAAPEAEEAPEAAEGIQTEPVTGNPWLTIWIRPRGTIRAVVDDASLSVALMPAVVGLVLALDSAISSPRGAMPIADVFIGAAFGGVIVGYLLNLVAGALVGKIGTWLGGTADWADSRSALAWGMVPYLEFAAASAVTYLVFGPPGSWAVLRGLKDQQSPYLIFGVFALSRLLVLIWSIVLVVRANAEVQRFSSWKSLASILLAIVLFYLVLCAIGGIGLLVTRVVAPGR